MEHVNSEHHDLHSKHIPNVESKICKEEIVRTNLAYNSVGINKTPSL